MKWYEQNYVNHRDWIIDNLEVLGLNEKEALIVLIIDFCNEHNMDISIDLLRQKTGLKNDELDKIISVLCAKKYLEIRASSKSVKFKLDGLFEVDVAHDQRVLDSPLFDLFESEFGRPLSQKEMEKVSDWNRTIDRKLIIYALREAVAYQKKSISYIDSVLNSWVKKGYTAESIQEGKK